MGRVMEEPLAVAVAQEHFAQVVRCPLPPPLVSEELLDFVERVQRVWREGVR